MKLHLTPFGLLLIAIFLLAPTRAAAQTPSTYTYSDITFDDGTGTILASGHTQADYQTGTYYQRTGAQSKIVDASGNQLALNRNEVTGVTADVSAQTDGYADQEYTVLTGHWLIANYYVYDYYNNGVYSSGYYDPYNYSNYEGQQGTTFYFDYTFYGYGPVVISYTSNKTLGQTTKKVRVGHPDHVWVVSDDTTYPDCGRPVRVIVYKIVDVNNRATGITRFQEKPYSIFDSCVGQYKTVGGDCLSTLPDAGIRDTINVECPTWHPCGFSYPNQFSWCEAPYDDPKIVIATVNAEASDTAVLVDGSEKFDPSTTIYP